MCLPSALCENYSNCDCQNYLNDENRDVECGVGGACASHVLCVCPTVKPDDVINCGTNNLCEDTEFCHCDTFLTAGNREVECASGGACENDLECLCFSLSPGDPLCGSGESCEFSSFCVDCDTLTINDLNFDDFCAPLTGVCLSHDNCVCHGKAYGDAECDPNA